MTALWNKKIQEIVQDTVEVPVNADAFSWDTLNEKISTKFELEGLKIEPLKTYWTNPEEVENLIHSENFFIELTAQPIAKTCYWLMEQEEVSKIISWILFKNDQGNSFSSELLQEGFYRYMILEALEIIEQDDLCHGLSLKIAQETKEVKESCLAVELQLTYLQQTCFAKIFLSKDFIEAWSEDIKKNIDFSRLPTAKSVDIPLSILIGETTLNTSMLESVTPGDVVLLDKTYYDSKTHQGFVLLQLKTAPLFQAKLQQDKIKILGHALPEKKDQTKEDFPLNIHVEISSFHIPLSHLMSLEEGSTIDLPHNIEQEAYLILDGSPIGKGELIKIGETSGFRITEITSSL